MEKNLKYFMRESAKKEEIVTVPGPESIKDEKGNVVNLEIKKLSNVTIEKIQENYRQKSIATDKKGNPYIQNGEIVFKIEKDNKRALRHLMVEAIQYPNMKDKEMMDFFGCTDVVDMPLLVFPTQDEFAMVSNLVLQVLGMVAPPEDDTQEIEAAKN